MFRFLKNILNWTHSLIDKMKHRNLRQLNLKSKPESKFAQLLCFCLLIKFT